MDSKRLAKIGIGCTIAMLIPTIILGWWAISWARGVAKWSERADEFPCISELRGPAPPAEENAALVYQQAWEALELTEEQEDTLRQSEDPEKLAPIVEQNQKALRLLHRAAQMEKCRFEPLADPESSFPDFPHLTPLRHVTMLLRAEALVDGDRDDISGALSAIEGRIRVAGHLMQAPYGLLEFLNARAQLSPASRSLETLLARADPGTTQSRSLRESLEALTPGKALLMAIQVDVAEGLSFLQEMTEGRTPSGDPKAREVYRKASKSPFYQWHLTLNQSKYMELSEERLQRAERPWRQVADLDPVTVPDSAIYIWIKLLPPHFGQLSAARDDVLATREMMLIALDIEAFIAEHGRPPESLDELIQARGIDDPDYALDPFSGERLRYRPDEDGGYTLWSIGRDLDDDGGVSQREAIDDRDRDSDDCDLVFRVEPAD